MRTFPGCLLPVLAAAGGALLLVAGCEPEVPGVVDGSDAGCPPARRAEVSSEAYFADVMVPRVFEPHCSLCHWSTRVGHDRHGAPEGLDYDVLSSATSRLGATWFRVSTYDMPPMGRVPDLEQMALLNEWLNCAFPLGDDDDSAGDDDSAR